MYKDNQCFSIHKQQNLRKELCERTDFRKEAISLEGLFRMREPLCLIEKINKIKTKLLTGFYRSCYIYLLKCVNCDTMYM